MCIYGVGYCIYMDTNETTATEVRYSELECSTCHRTIYWCQGH